MKRIYLLVFLFVYSLSFVNAQKFRQDTLLFSIDKDEIISRHHPKIDSMLRIIFDNPAPSYFIRIVGHADTTGTDAYNMALSKRRAVALVKYLVAKGVDSTRIEYQWRGFHQPVASNKSEDSRRYNRRTSVYLIYEKPEPKVEPKPEPPKPVPPKPKVDSVPPPPPPKPKVEPKPEPPKPKLVVDTLFSDKGPMAIDCNHQTVIFSPQGVKITIPPKAFQECNDKIKFELAEYFTVEDMIMKKMHTMTKKDMLDVQGVVCLKATKEGKPATVRATTSLIVEMPGQRHEREARIFSTTGTGNYSWRQVTVGNDIPSYDPDYKRYTMGMYELGCVAVAKRCESKDKKGYIINLKFKKLKDKNPSIYYVSKDGTSISNGKKASAGYTIENICQPGPATVIATQVVDGQYYIAYKDLSSKQIDELRKKRNTKMKLKFVKTSQDDLPVRIKEAL